MIRDYLIQLRKQQNENQQDIADVLGISKQYYCLIELGERQKRMDLIVASALAEHFRIPVSEVIAYENEWSAKGEHTNAGI